MTIQKLEGLEIEHELQKLEGLEIEHELQKIGEKK